MSVTTEILQCDWPGCCQTIAIGPGRLLTDFGWRVHSTWGGTCIYHVCHEHKSVTAKVLEDAIKEARRGAIERLAKRISGAKEEEGPEEAEAAVIRLSGFTDPDRCRDEDVNCNMTCETGVECRERNERDS